MVQLRQHMAGKQICLGGVRIAREDEGLNPLSLIGAQFPQHLIGITDNRRAAARARTADPGPQVVLDITVIAGDAAQFGLPLHPEILRVERLFADCAADLVIQFGDQAVCRSAGLVLGIADERGRGSQI